MEDFPTILAVDDERRGVEFLVRSLEELGSVRRAHSGDEAWEIASSQRIDLVITDQRMPGLSGVELLARLAEHDPHAGRILLTGYADLSATIDAINRGRAHAYLSKPCLPEELLFTVRAVLDRVRLSRENASLVGRLGERNAELESTLQKLHTVQERVLLAERLAAIGNLMAMLVHDVRGPLTVIRASGRELATTTDPLPADQTRSLGEMIEEEGRRIGQMCDELLEITRTGSASMRFEEIELDPMLEEVFGSLAEAAGSQGVVIESVLESGVTLPMDEYHLRRALLNLAYNALEAMPEGGRLRIATRRDASRAIVTLSDSGPGIPAGIRERLFEPFVTEGKARGSGLGLAVVKRVVDAHHGHISVRKGDAGGAEFELDFPLVQPA